MKTSAKYFGITVGP